MKINKIKLLSLILGLIMVLSCFAACNPAGPGESTPNEDGPNEPGKATVEYDLAEYKFIRPADCPTYLTTLTVSAKNKISEKIGTEVKISSDFLKDDVITDEIKNAKEILVGKTNREESATALAKLTEANTYIITVINNKIVINAQEDGVAAVGALYFVDNIASTLEGTKFKLEEGYCYISEPVNPVSIVNNGNTDAKVIYSSKLQYSVDSQTQATDYLFNQAKEFKNYINDQLGTKFSFGDDWVKSGTDTDALIEIIVGEVDRPEYEEFYNSLGYNEYGFKVIGNKLVIAGTNLTSTNLALESAKAFLKTAFVKNGDGTKSVVLYEGMERIDRSTTWYVDIPEFEGGKYISTHDGDYGDLMIYFEETTAAAFEAYCDKLEAAGYTLWQRHDLESNLHATYTNDDGLVHVTYTDYSKSVRILTALDGSYTLPKNPEKPKYTKVTDTLLTQMACDYSAAENGMAYIITLEDGSFVIFDGGNDLTNYNKKLYEKLVELNKRPDGKIVIAGWFISHIHGDHYRTFIKFCQNYGSLVDIDQVFVNTTSAAYEYNTVSNDRYFQNNVKNLQKLYKFDVVNVHTGMKFYLGNAMFEIIHTEEDVFPDQPYYFNDTSFVWKMTVDGQTSLWTGDASDVSAGIMIKRYAETIKADMVQLAHHGYVGCTKIFYMKVNAGVLFWPTSQKGYDDMNKTSYRYYWINQEAVKRAHTVLLANVNRTIKLPFAEGDDVIIG